MEATAAAQLCLGSLMGGASKKLVQLWKSLWSGLGFWDLGRSTLRPPIYGTTDTALDVNAAARVCGLGSCLS